MTRCYKRSRAPKVAGPRSRRHKAWIQASSLVVSGHADLFGVRRPTWTKLAGTGAAAGATELVTGADLDLTVSNLLWGRAALNFWLYQFWLYRC